MSTCTVGRPSLPGHGGLDPVPEGGDPGVHTKESLLWGVSGLTRGAATHPSAAPAMADNPGENVATVLLHCKGTATVALWGGGWADQVGLNVV